MNSLKLITVLTLLSTAKSQPKYAYKAIQWFPTPVEEEVEMETDAEKKEREAEVNDDSAFDTRSYLKPSNAFAAFFGRVQHALSRNTKLFVDKIGQYTFSQLVT